MKDCLYQIALHIYQSMGTLRKSQMIKKRRGEGLKYSILSNRVSMYAIEKKYCMGGGGGERKIKVEFCEW